jgi:hypothetical protein
MRESIDANTSQLATSSDAAIAGSPNRNPITVRSVLGGTSLMALLAVATPYAEYRMFSVELFQGQLPVGALASLIVILVPANWLLTRFRPEWRITVPELLFMFIMGFAGIMVYHVGMMGLFLSMISSPYYLASPENRYGELIIPHLNSWAVPANMNREMTSFYVGLPPGGTIPWAMWLGPLFWWWSFFLAFLLVCAAMTAILRKQWFDHEKVTFPQAEITSSLVIGTEDGNGLPRVMRLKTFWIGASVPFLIVAWNIVHNFAPLWPKIQFTQVLTELTIPHVRQFYTKPDFFIIGFSYLVDTKIAFSVWVLHLAIVAQNSIYGRLGVIADTRNDVWTTFNTLTAWQTLGGMLPWILWTLWMGRRHLRAVWERAWRAGEGADDSNELISYRVSVILFVGGLAYMWAWLIQTGLAWYVSLVFLLALIVLVVAVTRIVAEAGMPFVGAPVTAQGITLRTIGDANVAAESMVGIALSLAAFRMIEGYPMPMVMHSARLGDIVRARRRPLFAAILIGSVVAMVLMSVTTIYLAYNGGAFNFGGHHAFSQMTYAYDHIVSRIQAPWPRDPLLFAHFAAGAAFVGALLFFRYHLNRTIIHPVGFFTAGTFYHGTQWLSFFIAWLIKVIIMRVGGLEAYRRYKPLFIGLIAGQVAGAVLSLLVDYLFFFGQGHDIVTGFAF